MLTNQQSPYKRPRRQTRTSKTQQEHSQVSLMTDNSQNSEKLVKKEELVLNIDKLNLSQDRNLSRVSIQIISSDEDSQGGEGETALEHIQTEQHLLERKNMGINLSIIAEEELYNSIPKAQESPQLDIQGPKQKSTQVHKKLNPPAPKLQQTKRHNLKVCRICLNDNSQNPEEPDQTGKEDDLEYICPCNCKGSVRYVHHACMLAWINRIYQRANATKQDPSKLKCEICHYQFKYELGNKLECSKREEVSYVLSHNKVLLTICLLFILAGILGSVMLFLSAGKYNEGEGQKSTHKQEESTAYFYAMVLGGLAVLLITSGWVYKMVTCFLMKKVNYIQTVYNKV